jgi:hypothetical protein
LSCRAGAVTADIEKGAQSAIGSARNQQRLTGHRSCEIVTCLRDLALMSDQLPRASKDFFSFVREHLRIGGIDGEGHGASASIVQKWVDDTADREPSPFKMWGYIQERPQVRLSVSQIAEATQIG